MVATQQIKHNAIIPAMRYRELTKSIDWLCRAFGFTAHFVARNVEGQAVYAELLFDDNLIMLGSIADPRFELLMVQPDQVGGKETQTCYLVVDDVQKYYDRAKAVGAQIVVDLNKEAEGGFGFSCRDPEGHLWSFGTYDGLDKIKGRPVAPTVEHKPRKRFSVGLTATAASMVFASVATLWGMNQIVKPPKQDTMAISVPKHQELLDRVIGEQQAREVAERNLSVARNKLSELELSIKTEIARVQAAKVKLKKQEEKLGVTVDLNRQLLREISVEQKKQASLVDIQRQLRNDLENETAARQRAERSIAEHSAHARKDQDRVSNIERRNAELQGKLSKLTDLQKNASLDIGAVREKLLKEKQKTEDLQKQLRQSEANIRTVREDKSRADLLLLQLQERYRSEKSIRLAAQKIVRELEQQLLELRNVNVPERAKDSVPVPVQKSRIPDEANLRLKEPVEALALKPAISPKPKPAKPANKLAAQSATQSLSAASQPGPKTIQQSRDFRNRVRGF